MPARLFYSAAQQSISVAPPIGGMTMSIESGSAGPGDHAPARPDKPAVKYPRSAFVLPAALIASVGTWTLLSFEAGKPAGSDPVSLAAAVLEPAAPAPAMVPVIAFNPPTAEGEAIAPAETAAVDGLKISSQSWRRGGLGSKALVTFTLRNANAYAVRDIAISCAFSRSDGSHLTDRTRVIHDTVNMRGRKTFARLHVGFVNVNASGAKCAPVAARHI
jgi:hypothetical protein